MFTPRFILLFGLAAGWVHASPVAITNAGFEDITGETQQSEFTFSPPPGWELHDPSAITDGGAGPNYYVGTLTPFEADPTGNPGVYVNFLAGAPEGGRVAIAFNSNASGGQGEYGLVQTLAATLQANTTYTLSALIGNIASGQSMSSGYFNLNGFPGYRVDLLAGGVVIAQDDNTLLPGEGVFAESVTTFTTGANHAQLGQALGIRLVNLNIIDGTDTGADWEVDFDDVRLDATPVPEPASTVLVFGCWAGFAALWTRRRVRG